MQIEMFQREAEQSKVQVTLLQQQNKELLQENKKLKEGQSLEAAPRLASSLQNPNILEKERLIDELHAKIEALEQRIKQQDGEIVAKQMDRDSMRQQINSQSLSPLFFLNDHSREQFWQMLDSCKDNIERRADVSTGNLEQVSDYQIEIERLKGVIQTQEIDIQVQKEEMAAKARYQTEY